MSNLSVNRAGSTRIPTKHGEFQLAFYSNSIDAKEHLAFYMGDLSGGENILVRMHSECFTGDVLGSLRCDCGEQLDRSLRMIAEHGQGVVVYLRQEGRGIGLLQKIHAYNLQDAGHDTVDANLILGHQADERDYTVAVRILENFDVKSVRLITNNPIKIKALELAGIKVNERVELDDFANPENSRYLLTKAERMNHMLPLKNARSSDN
ncbi:MAG: GTP cyclohydrolase II [Pseudohongiellaceae bacterium]|jgi:GTP cyclohydrolase II